MLDKETVYIGIELHEMDFVSVLRAARLMGTSRENVIKQAVANYLVQMQKQGLDVGIQLPPEPEPEDKPDKPKSEKVKKGSDGGKE